jgi:nucleotide-binding universal stress UspA family protein
MAVDSAHRRLATMDEGAPTVVAGYEGRPQSRDALAFAELLAGAWDASVLAVWVPERDEPFSSSTRAALRGRLSEAHYLRTSAAEVLGDRGRWDLTAQAALWPADGLREVAAEQAARAIVVGSSHFGPVGRVLVGSTAARLLGDSRWPVGIAPSGWFEAGRTSPATIGVGLDGCEDCEAALAQALPLADQLGGELAALSVAGEGDEQVEAQLARAAHAGAAPHLLGGLPAEALAAASRELDLLVVGCRVCAGVVGHPLRSVSRRLIRTAACPLLVVPQAATRAEAEARQP